MIYDFMLDKKKQLTSHISFIQNQISHLPEGSLTCARNGKYFKWYYFDGRTSSYIRKKNRPFAEKLAYKKYLSFLLKDIQQQKAAVEAFLHLYPKESVIDHFLASSPEYRKLLRSHYKHESSDLHAWAQAPYNKNPHFKQNLIHTSLSGNMVRSKSEALIDTALFFNNIPFRYECALDLGEITVYPDFTLRHPVNGEFLLWEHFGMMDNPSYSQKAFEKLQLYIQAGYIPGINLITTFETSSHPLTNQKIERTIQHYFK